MGLRPGILSHATGLPVLVLCDCTRARCAGSVVNSGCYAGTATVFGKPFLHDRGGDEAGADEAMIR